MPVYLSIFEGAGKILFCGNPVQAIRAKRQKLRVSGKKVLQCSGENYSISLNKLWDESILHTLWSIYMSYFCLAVPHKAELSLSAERNNGLYGLWQAIMNAWHQQLISLMSCQYKKNQLIIIRQTETWEDKHSEGWWRCVKGSVRWSWQTGLSMSPPSDLSCWHKYTSRLSFCVLFLPFCLIQSALALPLCPHYS